MPFKKTFFFDISSIAVLSVSIAVFLSLLIITGWSFNIPFLQSFNSHWPTIKANTALGIIFSGISLYLFRKNRIQTGLVFALLVFLIGVLTLGEHIFHFNAGIDELFFSEKDPARGTHGRMPQFTCIAFSFFGLSLLTYASKRKWIQYLSQFFATLVLVLSSAGFVGALYDAGQSFRSANLAAFSIPASLSGILMSVGILFSKPFSGFLAFFHKQTTAAKAGIRMILISIVALVGIGWLCLQGENVGIFDPAMGLVIMIITFIISFLFIAVSGIHRLNQSEDQLIASEKNLGHVLSSTADVYYVVDKNYYITLINEMAERNLSKAWGTVVKKGINILDVIPDEKYEPIRKSFANVFKGEKVEYELHQLKWKDLPEWVSVSYKPVMDSNGTVIGAYIVTKNITKNKKAEEGLRQSNNRFELISRTTNDAIWEWDLETGELWSNATHQELYGLLHSDPVPKADKWGERIHPDDRKVILEKQEASLVSDKNVFITEYRFNVEGKGYRNIYDRCYIVRNEGGKAIRMMGSMIDVTEQKEIEDELRKSKERYRSLIEQASDYIMITDTQGRFTDVNSSLCKTFGYTKEELLGMTIYDIIDPVQLKTDPIRFDLLMGGKAMLRERRMMNKNGTIIEVEANVKLLPDGRVLAIARNIAERKKAEEELKRSEERYRSLVENASEALVVFDMEQKKFVSVSESAVKLFKMTKEELLKIGPLDISPEYQPNGRLSAEMAIERLNEAIAGHKPSFEWIHCDKEGLLIPCEVRLVRLPAENQILIRGVIIDISERKKAEEAIRSVEETRRLIMDSALDAIVGMNTSGAITVWTPQAENIFGWKEEEILGKAIADTIIPERYRQQHRAGLKRYLETGKGVLLNKLLEISALDRNGREFPIEISIVPVKQGETEFFCAFIRDITDRKKAEEALAESENRLRTIVQAEPECVKLLGFNCELEDMNPAGLKMIEADRLEDVKGKSVLGIINEEYRKAFEELTHTIFKGRSGTLEFEITGLKGTQRWLETHAVPLKDTEGKIIFALGVTRDITEHKKAQQIITKEKELSDSIINSMPGIFYLFDETGKYMRWNRFKEIITGYSHKEMQKMSPLDFFEGREKEYVQKHIEECFRTGETNLEASIMTKEGKKIPFFFTGILVEYEGKRCMLGTGINIADRKKAEEEVQQSYEAIRKLTEHLQNIREEERTHIAREIHDELGQQLTVLKMDASWLNKKLSTTDDNVKEKLRDLLELLDGTVRTVRKISSELRPSLLDDMGLVAAMEWHLKEFEKRVSVKTKFSMPSNDLPLSEGIKTGLFRIFQESLTNVARHANAKKVEVSLLRQNGSIILSIKDDGKGFDREKAANKKTLGILGMEERSFMMGGSYQINSKPGKGTLVVVSVPYNE